jgi:membrane-associated phospholipid phosphatase
VWQNLTPAQKTIAETWNLQAGSVTPPGVWNQRALAVIRASKLDPAQAVRVLAVLNAAMNDAAIVCWRTKYEWWVVRPVSVIRERHDAKFLPHLVTPPHPSYTSGHSSVSGAAEIALTAFFPAQRAEFHAMAEEAAMSRLYGGIHYRSDNEEGLQLGRRVAEQVVKRAMPAPD